nr:pentatricopeptide repeat-containing protein [Tanacetum cinerariifolium]
MAPSSSNALYFDVHHDECNLEVGLKIIERDFNVAAMYDFADSYGKLDMFMSHIHQNLAEFYFQNPDMEESGDEATSRLIIHEIMVKDASNMSYDELVSWAQEDAQIPKLKHKLLSRNNLIPIAKRKLMGKVTSPTSYVVNKGRSVLNEGNTVKKYVERGKSTMVEDANTVKKAVDKDSKSDPTHGINYSLYSDSDSDSEYFDKSVDYLSEGEDELIDIRKRKIKAKNTPKQYVVGDNETVIEHEEFMDDLLRKLSQANGNGIDEAVKEVMPYTEHRQCARHIYKGFRKQYSERKVKKTPLAGSSLIDDDIETQVIDEQVRVEEQSSQFDVRGSSQFDVRGSSQFDVGVQEQTSNFDVGGSSDVRGCS